MFLKMLGVIGISLNCLIGIGKVQGKEVHIHYGHFKSLEERELLRTSGVSPSLNKELSVFKEQLASKDIKLVEVLESSSQDLINSLNDPKVSGVIWLGEAQLSTECINCDDSDLREIQVYNGFLLDAEQRNIPKSIVKAAHEKLQFFAIGSCYSTSLSRYYDFQNVVLSYHHWADAIQEKIIEAAINNPFVELSQMHTVFRNVLRVINRQDLLASTYESKASDELKIYYRDLKSSSFSYSVFVDDQLIGVLKPGHLAGKLMAPNAEISFRLPSSTIRKIEIVPDDANRKVISLNNPIDNIIVDQIRLNGKDLLGGSVQIGDFDEADSETGLRFHQNVQELISLPIHSSLVISP